MLDKTINYIGKKENIEKINSYSNKHWKKFVFILVCWIIFLLSSFFVNAGTYYDDFNRATLGTNYSATDSNTAQINTSSFLYVPLSNGDNYFYLNQYNLTNVTIKTMLSTGQNGIEAVLRYNGLSGANAKFYIAYWVLGNNQIKLYKFETNTFTEIGTQVAQTPALYDNITFSIIGSNILFYVNGVLKRNETNTAITSAGYFGLRKESSWSLDNLNITSNEIITPSAPDRPSYNVTNIQTPTDINSTTLHIDINTSISNLTNTSYINSSGYTEIYYKLYTSLNNGCSIFYQTLCHQADNNVIRNMSQISNNSYFIHLDDTEIIPAYYPFDYDYIDNTVGLNYTAYNNNNIKFNIFNFSTSLNTTYLAIEMDAINLTSNTASMLIYYCNSSYTTGNPLTSTNCELIQTYLPQSWSHVHNQSRHGGFTFQINSITKTQNSSIIFVSPNLLPSNGWRFRYVTNTTYNNQSFQNGNFNSWATTTFIYDIHLHQYNPTTDYIQYYTKYYDGNSNSNESSITTDFYNVTQYPPTIPQLITPNCSTTFTLGGSETIPFTWTNSSDVNSDTINYTLTIYNILYQNIHDYSTNTTNYTYDFNSLNSGTYYTRLSTCDNFNNCAYGDINCNFSLCTNNWLNTTGICIANSQLVTVYDGNSCPSAYNVPAYNNTYISCVTPATKIQYEFSESQLIIGLILFFIILSIISGVLINTIFFYLTALLFGFLLSVCVYYDLPPIMIIICSIFIIMFIIIGIYSKKNR